MKYSYDARVGYSEVAKNGYMTPGAVVDRFQDCSNFQSEELGVGVEYLNSNKKAWILNSWMIRFEHPLRMGEKIRVCTWAHRFDRTFGYRNFTIENEAGDRCACAGSKWMMVNTETMNLIRIPDYDAKVYGQDEKLDIEYGTGKMKAPDNACEIDRIKVRRYHTDTNGHMNNSWYIKIATEYTDERYLVEELRIEYRKAAMPGSNMVIKKAAENNLTTIVMCDESDGVYCVAEIKQKGGI